MDNTFDAMCPHCGGKGCKRCENKGTREARFAEGDWYTRHCTNPECGFNNGGRIVPAGTHPDDHDHPGDYEGDDKCVVCGERTVKWVLYQDAPESDAWIKNQDKFMVKRQEKTIQKLVAEIKALKLLSLQIFEGKKELTMEECRQIDICRVCKKPISVPFVTSYGKEFAHSDCLDRIGENPYDYRRN